MNSLLLTEDEIIINNEAIKIKPVKVKHIKNNFYGYYLIIKQMGIIKLLKYADGEQILRSFLNGVFNDDEEVINKIMDELDNDKIKQILDIVKKINEIDDEEDSKNV
jgi:hypothetical protein